MDADRLRAARDRGLVTTDVSSRAHVVSNPGKEIAPDLEPKETTGWRRLLKFMSPK